MSRGRFLCVFLFHAECCDNYSQPHISPHWEQNLIERLLRLSRRCFGTPHLQQRIAGIGRWTGRGSRLLSVLLSRQQLLSADVVAVSLLGSMTMCSSILVYVSAGTVIGVRSVDLALVSVKLSEPANGAVAVRVCFVTGASRTGFLIGISMEAKSTTVFKPAALLLAAAFSARFLNAQSPEVAVGIFSGSLPILRLAGFLENFDICNTICRWISNGFQIFHVYTEKIFPAARLWVIY